jgi:tRNA-dihydrouridine synthase
MPTMDVLSLYIADIRAWRLIPDDRKAIIEYRKYILWYIRSIPHLKDLKQQIATSTTYESMRACVEAIVA